MSTRSTATTPPVTAEPDPERLEAFVDDVLDDIKGHQVALMASLGDHLGLFDALAEGQATSSELARRTGLHERYVREWLAGMTAAEYVDYDPEQDTFRMSPEQATVLAPGATPVSLAGLFHENAAVYAIFDDLVQAFRTGGAWRWPTIRMPGGTAWSGSPAPGSTTSCSTSGSPPPTASTRP